MRINGFEQIKAFYSWVFNNPDKVRPTHISLYLFLWNQGNRANWVEWFKCPYDLAMQGACIGSKGTYYKCLDDLQQFKLIDYKKGLNNYKAPQIHLIKLYKTEQLTEQVTVPLSEPHGEPLSEQLPSNIYKLITNNKKHIIDNLENWINSLDESKLNISYTDFLQNEYPIKYETMLKGLLTINQKEFLDFFNNKCIMEDIPFDYRKIEARFYLLKSNWNKDKPKDTSNETIFERMARIEKEAKNGY